VSMKTITQLESFLKNDLHLPNKAAELTPFPSPISHLHLNEIQYSYFNTEIDDSFTLGPITTTIRSGEITYIIGGNGSGKTTLGKLICGLYIPDKGYFSFNDTPINHVDYRYRDHFSVILSDFYLFDHQLELKTASYDQVMHYIKAFHLEHKVSFKNGQFSTLNLSSGQRKRLALIISFLQDRPIYIFDEWASDQDPEFKSIFYDDILPLLKQQNKIVIVITHDDFYFEKADRIIRLCNGALCVPSAK
jgi:putative ATP-binding cassette transporter